MRLCFVTDVLGYMPFEDMLDTVRDLGYEALEFGCGNWSPAPHIDIDALLESPAKRTAFMDALKKRGFEIGALNCSGNHLAPGEMGRAHQAVVEKTFRLAEMLGVKKIVMMSGLPGGSPKDETPVWVVTSWPPEVVKVLAWQWNERLLPYWEKAVKTAADHGIEKIAIENHGQQMVMNPETLMRLRAHAGEMVGMNLDPGHHFWMGGDPIAAARFLGSALYHVHAKDTRLERGPVDINGVLDTKTIDCFAGRAWNYVALGYGHDAAWWKEFLSVVSMTGYDGDISLEMEDMTMDPLTGVIKSTEILKAAMPRTF